MRADAPDLGGGGGLARRRWEAERDGPSAMVISGPPPVLPTARRRPMRLELRARTGKALLKDGDERLERDHAKTFATQRHPYDVRAQILERLAPLPRKSLLETSTTPERPRALGLLRPRLNYSSNSNHKDDEDDDVDIYRIRTASNSSSTSSFAGSNDRHHDADKVDRLHYPELALCALHVDLSTWRTRQQDAFRLAQDPARLLADDLTEPFHDHLDTARRVLEPSEASIEPCLVSLVPVPDSATPSSASSSSSSAAENPSSSSSELAAMRKLQHELGDDPMDVDEDENSRDAVDAANAATAAALVERVLRADAEAAAAEASAMTFESTMRDTIPLEMTQIEAPSVPDNNNNEDKNNNNNDDDDGEEEENDNEDNKNNDDEAIGRTRVNCDVEQDENLDAKQNEHDKAKHDDGKQETNVGLNAGSTPQASAPALCDLAMSFDETKSKPLIKQKAAIDTEDQRKSEQVDQEVIVIEDSDEDEAPESDAKIATSEHEAKSLFSAPLQPSMALRKRKRRAQEATHDAFDDRKSNAPDDEKVDKNGDVNEDAGDETKENLAERSRMESHVKHRRTLSRDDIEDENNDSESTNDVTEVSPSMDDNPSLAESAFRGDCKSTASNTASAPPKSAVHDSTPAFDIAEGPKLPLDHAKSLSVASVSSMSSGSMATHLTDRYSQPPATQDADTTNSNATAKSATVMLQGPQEVNDEESSLLREREGMEKEDLRGQVSALRLKVQALEIAVDNVRGEHSQAVDASAATSQSFEERIAVLHAEKETSASEASSLREALEQAHLKLETANQDRQSAHERANQLLAVATQEKNDRAKIESIAQTMSSQLTGAENEAFRLQSQLQDESNRRTHLEREVLQVRSMVRAASMQCQRWESHVSEVLGKFDQQVRSLEGRRAKLKTVLDAQHRSRLASARHTDELTSKIESLQKQASPRCLVCMHAPIAVCYVPCGHRSVCPACDTRIKVCPVCRAAIRERVRTYDAGV
ncbi:Baculoviral IAP repeat-containing protein 7 [Hondaea fermentalgiana]|uniref:Baculoviral IAP repeat-containing protein 7 n=1 Tax=Hondaea fermentalgiana TaxID=2315210 RepID=A0A2R5GVB7_9STRA|nr:Baculoviral IAP repeat-containing protein 7 [Hondaea fermentalgiana]|eukprot:GBG32341.1 Baculoviral IAP repeat-containing protein 7 [Hondaea fermentalgiana]